MAPSLTPVLMALETCCKLFFFPLSKPSVNSVMELFLLSLLSPCSSLKFPARASTWGGRIFPSYTGAGGTGQGHLGDMPTLMSLLSLRDLLNRSLMLMPRPSMVLSPSLPLARRPLRLGGPSRFKSYKPISCVCPQLKCNFETNLLDCNNYTGRAN